MTDREYISTFSDYLFWDVSKSSIDLDFFGNASGSLDEIVVAISPFAQVKPISSSKMMRFLNYPYAWIDEPVMENGIVLAGIKDIAAMKLSAITNRGTKKDKVNCSRSLKV